MCSLRRRNKDGKENKSVLSFRHITHGCVILVPFLNLFSLLQTIILSKLCYAKISLIFQSDFSFLCAWSWQFWWESTSFSLQRKGSKQLPASQNDRVQFWTFSSNTSCGIFLFVCVSQAARSREFGREGGILLVPIQSCLLTGLWELHSSAFTSIPPLVRAPNLWFHHHLILHWRQLILEFFFLTCRNKLFYNLSSVLSYKVHSSNISEVVISV